MLWRTRHYIFLACWIYNLVPGKILEYAFYGGYIFNMSQNIFGLFNSDSRKTGTLLISAIGTVVLD